MNMTAVEIPLASIADEILADLAVATCSKEIASIDGPTLLGERAMLAGSVIPDMTSAGGGCHLFKAIDGTAVALNLARNDDRELLPALFVTDSVDSTDDRAISKCVALSDAEALVERGRTLGLAIASESEAPIVSDFPCTELIAGKLIERRTRDRPRVVDLSALWAGPLASSLLQMAGAEVVKIESRTRPDAMRGVADFYALLNQGKASISLDLKTPAGLAALHSLIRTADIVIESSRPRALQQLGIDAATILSTQPGLIWISITAHGAHGAAANWVGFGDDCGVAGGLSGALRESCGRTGFVGDAIADPITGIFASSVAWNAWRNKRGGRFGIAMSSVVAYCVSRAKNNGSQFANSLRAWNEAAGKPFPLVRRRPIGAFAKLGEHNRQFAA